MGEDVSPVQRYHADDPWAEESGVWVYYEDHADVVAALEARIEKLKTDAAWLEDGARKAATQRWAAELQRDAARAEVERLRSGDATIFDDAAAYLGERDGLIRERDEARAEVERLRRQGEQAGIDHSREVERLRDENGRIAVDHYDAIRANGRLVRDHAEVCAKLDDALTLLGECASYDYGSSWPAYLRRRVDAILDRAATNNEEPVLRGHAEAVEPPEAGERHSTTGSSPSPTDAVVDAARKWRKADKVLCDTSWDPAAREECHRATNRLRSAVDAALDAARKEG